MIDILRNSAFFGVLISIGGYVLGLLIKKKFRKAIFNPLLISILFVMILLFLCHVDYKSYSAGAKNLSYLLSPATICLAIPLYQQLELLKKNYKAILLGILSGVISCLGTVFVLSALFHFSHVQYVTLLPKSITTAFGMGVSEELGGLVAVTVVVIIITGVFGNMIAETVCRIFRINEPIAKGIAIGTASHAIGTAKAFEMGEIEGAMSSLAIAVSGLITVIGASLFSLLI